MGKVNRPGSQNSGIVRSFRRLFTFLALVITGILLLLLLPIVAALWLILPHKHFKRLFGPVLTGMLSLWNRALAAFKGVPFQPVEKPSHVGSPWLKEDLFDAILLAQEQKELCATVEQHGNGSIELREFRQGFFREGGEFFAFAAVKDAYGVQMAVGYVEVQFASTSELTPEPVGAFGKANDRPSDERQSYGPFLCNVGSFTSDPQRLSSDTQIDVEEGRKAASGKGGTPSTSLQESTLEGRGTQQKALS